MPTDQIETVRRQVAKLDAVIARLRSTPIPPGKRVIVVETLERVLAQQKLAQAILRQLLAEPAAQDCASRDARGLPDS